MAKVTRLIPARSATLVNDCRDIAHRRLPAIMKGVLERFDDALFELANKSDSSQQQTLYFDALRELRLKSHQFEQRFLDAFDARIAAALEDPAPHGGRGEPGTLTLALVDADEVEQDLAVTNFAESLKTRCREELFALDQRVALLLNARAADTVDNPFAPIVLGKAFKEALAELDAGIEVKLTLYKLLERFAAVDLQSVYQAINAKLIEQGILPQVTSGVRSNPGRRTRVTIESEGDSVDATGSDMFSTLQNLMHSSGFQGLTGGFGAAGGRFTEAGGAPHAGGGLGGGKGCGIIGGGAPSGGFGGVAGGGVAGHGSAGPGYPSSGSGGHGAAGSGTSGGGSTGEANGFPPLAGSGGGGAVMAVPTATIINTLTEVQHGDLSNTMGSFADTLTPADVQSGRVNVVRALRETEGIGSVNDTDGLTLDIVSLIFDYVLGDPAIPDSIKALIGRLQIPMLKVALLDKELFSRKSHPARRFLDALAEGAVGWSDGLRDQDAFFETVERLIKQVVNEFDDDPGIFGTVLEELDAFLATDHERAEAQAMASAESLSTRERVVLAKMAVDDALKRSLEGRECREFIREFVFDYWRQILIVTWLTEGPDSDAWRDQLCTADDLIWSVQEKAGPEERKALTEKLPQLLKNLKSGMADLDIDRTVCSRFLSMLASVHVVSVKQREESTLAERKLRTLDADPGLKDTPQDSEAFVREGLERLFERKGVDTLELDIDLSMLESEAAAPSDGEDICAADVLDALQPHIETATALDLGDWIEFVDPDGATTRARFTWISPATGRYLFTTRQGQKALDTTLTELARMLSDGRATGIESQPDPLFDRAIGDLMERLEQQVAVG